MTIFEQAIFFELLRSAIWQRPAEQAPFNADFSWSAICKALEDHALLAVAADAIMTVNEQLPSEKQLTPMQSMAIYQHSAAIAQTHYELNQSVIDIFARLSSQAIHPVLLKGQGLASIYPITNTRSCGDIDIYVGKDDYPKAKQILDDLCSEEEKKEAKEDPHQYHIAHDSVIYELHPVAGFAAISFYQKQYEQWAYRELVSSKCEYVHIDLQDNQTHNIPIPNAQFNIPYLFDHLCRHLRFQGVGIRQFVDIALVLHQAATKGQSAFDTEAFKADLDRLGLFRAWQILSGILVYNLGLPKSECPFFNERKAKKSQTALLQNIIADAHFGFESEWRHEEEQHSYNFHRVLLCYRQQWRYLRLDFQLFPLFSIYEFLRQTTRTLFIALGLKEANY